MSNKNHLLRPTLDKSPVIPVLVIDRTEDAIPIAQALVDGGLRILEITLRTANALEVIREISQNVPRAIVAAGTITTWPGTPLFKVQGRRIQCTPASGGFSSIMTISRRC